MAETEAVSTSLWEVDFLTNIFKSVKDIFSKAYKEACYLCDNCFIYVQTQDKSITHMCLAQSNNISLSYSGTISVPHKSCIHNTNLFTSAKSNLVHKNQGCQFQYKTCQNLGSGCGRSLALRWEAVIKATEIAGWCRFQNRIEQLENPSWKRASRELTFIHENEELASCRGLSRVHSKELAQHRRWSMVQNLRQKDTGRRKTNWEKRTGSWPLDN